MLPRKFSVRTFKAGASVAGSAGSPGGFAAEQAGEEGRGAHRGVRLSFITRCGVAFLSEGRTLAGGGCAAPFSALRAPWEAGECPGSSVPAGDGALDSAER